MKRAASERVRILHVSEVAELAEELQRAGGRVVFTNGCFDLLHRGHVEYLRQARNLGDYLIVGLNDDEAVRQLKGPGRPLMPEEDRAVVLAELRCVDAVVIFPGLTAKDLVAALRPEVYVKGGDWGPGRKQPPEAAVVQSYGGEVVYLPYWPGRSTSDLLAQIRASTESSSLCLKHR